MKVIYAGIDIGSTAGKIVLLDQDNKILGYKIIEIEAGPEKTGRTCLDLVLKDSGLQSSEIAYIVGTGYGRMKIPFADTNISETSCHASGAKWLCPTARTVLDVGGQDCKAISVREDGRVASFVLNDKCAAGTGRFLENQARVLELKIQELSELSMRATSPAVISSQCSVFAESEVITKVNEGFKLEDIVAGINEAVAMRLTGLLKRLGIKEDLIVTGGCAKNEGLISILEQKIGIKLARSPEDPQIAGALGAALLAKQSCEKDRASAELSERPPKIRQGGSN